jgi:hypothetical protein
MKRIKRALERLIAASGLVVAFGCGGEDFTTPQEDAAAEGGVAPDGGTGGMAEAGRPPGCPAPADPTVHGIGAAGRVDVTAAQAWPNRAPETPALTLEEIAQACATFGSCLTGTLDAGTLGITDGATTDPEVAKADLIRLCALGLQGSEERAIPNGGYNERFAFEVRAAIAAHGDCAAVAAIHTERPAAIKCQEDGCWWSEAEAPTASCEGEVAVLVSGGSTFRRDCSHALTTCNGSATGCTDRPLVACDPAAGDRCDGDIKLGCDHCGLVSFRDCARLAGGHCVEKDDGTASCVYAAGTGCGPADQVCTGTMLTVCAAGTKTAVDCLALGFSGCQNGHCTAP